MILSLLIGLRPQTSNFLNETTFMFYLISDFDVLTLINHTLVIRWFLKVKQNYGAKHVDIYNEDQEPFLLYLYNKNKRNNI
jgi:hypothetical protein